MVPLPWDALLWLSGTHATPFLSQTPPSPAVVPPESPNSGVRNPLVILHILVTLPDFLVEVTSSRVFDIAAHYLPYSSCEQLNVCERRALGMGFVPDKGDPEGSSGPFPHVRTQGGWQSAPQKQALTKHQPARPLISNFPAPGARRDTHSWSEASVSRVLGQPPQWMKEGRNPRSTS